MNFIFIIVFFIFTIFNYGQNTTNEIYLDENSEQIDFINYNTKCLKYHLKCLKYNYKDITINRVVSKFKFGTLNEIEYNQIKTTLFKDSTINKNNVLVIKYYDSLINFSSALENHKKHVKSHEMSPLASGLTIKHHTFNKKTFNKSRAKFVKKNKKCKVKFEKKHPINLTYIYNYQENVIKFYQDLNLIKDQGVFKNKFFQIPLQFRTLIIKPNGDYFLNGGHLTDERFIKMLEIDNWEVFKKDLKITIEKYPISGYGVFKKIDGTHDNTHCL